MLIIKFVFLQNGKNFWSEIKKISNTQPLRCWAWIQKEPNSDCIELGIRRNQIQTTLSAQQSLGTQSPHEAPSDFWVKLELMELMCMRIRLALGQPTSWWNKNLQYYVLVEKLIFPWSEYIMTFQCVSSENDIEYYIEICKCL